MSARHFLLWFGIALLWFGVGACGGADDGDDNPPSAADLAAVAVDVDGYPDPAFAAAPVDFGEDRSLVEQDGVLVSIIAPAHELRLGRIETLELVGEAFLDDAPAADEDLVWSSDYDGFLGVGPELVVQRLSVGPHRITLNYGGVEASIGLAVFEKTWSIMIYMDGDNNLEANAIQDVNEMEQIGSDSNIDINVLLDRIPSYDSTNGNWTTTRVYHVVADSNTSIINSTLIGDVGEKKMDDPSTLASWEYWGVTSYPAARYAMVIWDHGSGWSKSLGKPTKGSCSDYTSGSGELEIWEVSAAMQQLATQYGITKIDLLGYDCCLMGMAEVGYETSGLTSVFVGSEETEPGDGWEYQRWLASLKANPTADAKTLGGYIVSAYYGTGYSTLSAADMTQTTTFVNAVNALADALIAAVPSYKTKIKNARTATKKYADTTYLDLYDFCTKLRAQSLPAAVTTAAANLQTVISSNYIIAKGGSATYSNGVSIWFPAKLTTATFNTYHNTIKWGAATRWPEFLDTYY